MNSNALKKTYDASAKSWVDWANLVLGTFILVSPWLGFGGGTAVALNAVICGVIIACAAGAALVKPTPAAEKTNAWLGVWLLVAPWIVGFSGNAGATWASALVGLVIACFALLQLSHLKRPARM